MQNPKNRAKKRKGKKNNQPNKKTTASLKLMGKFFVFKSLILDKKHTL